MISRDKESIKSILKQHSNKSYVYGLCRQDGRLFYVGVGTKYRLFAHERKSALTREKNLIKKRIIEKEKSLSYVLFIVSGDRQKCFDLEMALISKFGKVCENSGILANISSGGESGAFGKTTSEETKQKMRESQEKIKDKKSEATKKQWENVSKEERKRSTDYAKQFYTDEYLDKISKTSKERWSDPEYKKRLSLKQKESQSKIADAHRQRNKEKWTDPAFREMMLEARRVARQRKLASKSATV